MVGGFFNEKLVILNFIVHYSWPPDRWRIFPPNQEPEVNAVSVCGLVVLADAQVYHPLWTANKMPPDAPAWAEKCISASANVSALPTGSGVEMETRECEDILDARS